ncbi:MAG: hypothetical protein R6X02_29905 [Enhygromyxa sp.]
MSRLEDHSGDVMVEVVIRWEEPRVPGSLYVEANEVTKGEPKKKRIKPPFCHLLTDTVRYVVVKPPNQPVPTHKVRLTQQLGGSDHPNQKWRLFNPERGTYRLGPINTTDMEALLVMKTVDVEIRLDARRIFDAILKIWAKSSTASNLANRKDDDWVLETIIAKKDLGSKKKSVDFSPVVESLLFSASAEIVECVDQGSQPTDQEKKPAGEEDNWYWKGSSPAIRMILTIKNPSAKFVRKAAAANWSWLSTCEVKEGTNAGKLPRGMVEAFLNVQKHIAAALDMRGAEKIFDAIVARNQSEPNARQLVIKTRADIDRHVIVANHWGDARESISSSDPVERYQSRMSDFFGSLYEDHTLASPVNLVRGLFEATQDRGAAFGINLPSRPGLFEKVPLLVGVGHCGEHAILGFDLLCAIAKGGGKKVIKHVIQSGNANIDHAFVLVNIEVPVVFKTWVLNENSKQSRHRAPILVLNLKDALADPDNAGGLVFDAYLQLDRFDANPAKLLHSLQNKKNAGMNTVYVTATRFFPNQPDIGDMTWMSESELRKQFPNI